MRTLSRSGVKRMICLPGFHMAVLGVFTALAVAISLRGAFLGATEVMVKVADDKMSPEERTRVLVRLEEKDMPFEFRDGAICARLEDAERVLLTLYTDGVYTRKTLLRMTQSWGSYVDEWQFKARCRLALRLKLERMIPHIVPVIRASVAITLQGKDERMSICVGLELDPAHEDLGQEDVALVALVVSRVAGDVPPQRVCIVNDRGQVYRIPERCVIELEKPH